MAGCNQSSRLLRSERFFGNRDRGGQNAPNARGGGELAPKVVLGKLGLLTPKLRIFYRSSVEKGRIQGPPKIHSFHPPLIFGHLTPSIPVQLLLSQERKRHIPFELLGNPHRPLSFIRQTILGSFTRTLLPERSSKARGYLLTGCLLIVCYQPAPRYHTKGCSRSSVDSPGARKLVFEAFESFSSCEFRAAIARTPFCAILWRSPTGKEEAHTIRNAWITLHHFIFQELV